MLIDLSVMTVEEVIDLMSDDDRLAIRIQEAEKMIIPHK